MKKIFTLLALSASIAAFATDTPFVQGTPDTGSSKATLALDTKSRALDYQQAFELLRKEKPANKVYFQLSDGSKISQIIDMKIMGHGSLILFRFESPQGIKFQTVQVEDIVALKNF